ncbi:MAG TPA: alkaline phosphatase D family protein [Solirubrobacteraceae bacterium]|nr:alkaline phosphatase D family protein [Solirubrobacteraceae bacterium]
MANLLLGPMLRYVGRHDATIWVETDAPCEVEVLGHTRRTFSVAGHYYALVHVHGLEDGGTYPYEVRLDGTVAWPGDDGRFPPSTIRTHGGMGPLRLAFGSCRVALPHEPPYTLTKDQDERGREIDALYALTRRMVDQPAHEWPSLLLWVGDQVYADEISPGVRRLIDDRTPQERNHAPLDEVADFEEYCWLYWEAMGEDTIRWLLSNVPSAMIFDDHDVHDDWNTSGAWVAQIRRQPWWQSRIEGAYMSYWIYQHIGNLTPRELADDEMWQRVRPGADLTDDLRDFARRAERQVEGSRWSYSRDLGRTRLIVMDSRAGRVVDDDRHRRMLDEREWEWIVDRATGDFDHLLLATSLPFLLAPGVHELEAWNEALCAGAWGQRFRGPSEKLRQALDLEHWPAFHTSFEEVVELVEEIASGRRGSPPATITFLSGDVHHAYLCEAALRRSVGARSAVYQAVCSPYRNPLDSKERRIMRAGWSRPAHAVAAALARAAGVPAPPIRWRMVGEEPIFDNQVATLELEDRSAQLRVERTAVDDGDEPRLHESFHARLS